MSFGGEYLASLGQVFERTSSQYLSQTNFDAVGLLSFILSMRNFITPPNEQGQVPN
jgi:hypothetical protein